MDQTGLSKTIKFVILFDSERGQLWISTTLFYMHEGMASAELEVPTLDVSFDTPNRDRFLRDNFHKKRDSFAILGRGSYGVVIKASYRGHPVAVKILEKRSCLRPRYDTLLNEANALYVRHDNIVTVLKIVSGTQYGLVLMERFDGHCLQRILDNQRHLPIPLQHKLLILCDVINGLYFCHLHQLVHLDVKPQNVIVTLNPSTNINRIPTEDAAFFQVRKYLCKLCDFGSSMMLASWPRNETLVNRGTIRYMSPELLCGQQRTTGGVSERADIYSFGVTIWQLHEERFPYEEIKCNEVVAYNVVKKGLRPDCVTTVTNEFRRRSNNLPIKRQCLHLSYLSPGSFAGAKTLDARFEPEAVDHVLKRQGIAVEYTQKLQGTKKYPIGAICSEERETDKKLSAARISTLFCDDCRIPSHECSNVRKMIQTLYSKCWLTDPSSRPDAATVRKAIHQAVKKIAHCKRAN
uniref:non-specific serine/threonine protein kinase n=1 Tax=Anopheles atroparvus TaxID=41427 RepID=A0AAG5DAN2_ANOAO